MTLHHAPNQEDEASEQQICNNLQSCRHIDLLFEMSSDILSCFDLKRITHSLYENINKLIDAPLFALAIYNENVHELEFWGVKDKNEALRMGNISCNQTDVWSVHSFLNREELIFNTPPPSPAMKFSKRLFDLPDNERQSFIYLPLTTKNGCIGVITVQSTKANAYNQKQVNILRSLANFIALSVENAQAFNHIEEQNQEIRMKTTILEATLENMEEIIKLRTAQVEEQKEELATKSMCLARANKDLEMLSIVAKETNNAIMIMDPEGNVLWINDCFTRLYGYTFDAFIETRGKNIRCTSFNPEINNILGECINNKKPVVYQAYNVSPNGAGVWTQTMLTPVLDDSGCIKNLVTIDSDITKIIEAEAQIKEQSENITNSIRYASEIQRSILPSRQCLANEFDDVMILYRPRDIVSGDFYWYHGDENWIWVVAADCTGHGVPAALMSILCTSLLQEISRKYPIDNPAQILDYLRTMLKDTIRQRSEKYTMNDGMDVALCMISRDKRTLLFAGAYNPAIIIRGDELVEIKGDKMPVGNHRLDQTPFTYKEFKLAPGDKIYVFSDGFASQFGGPDGRKFMKRHFYETLQANATKTMQEQKQTLKQTLSDWMEGADNNQTDDILVVGLSV